MYINTYIFIYPIHANVSSNIPWSIRATEWLRVIWCLIFIGNFPPKSPIISGSFAKMTCNLRHPMSLRLPVQCNLMRWRTFLIMFQLCTAFDTRTLTHLHAHTHAHTNVILTNVHDTHYSTPNMHTSRRRSYMYTKTHTCTHAHRHTQTQTRTHARTHAHTHNYTHINTHTHSQTCTHTVKHAHTHTIFLSLSLTHTHT